MMKMMTFLFLLIPLSCVMTVQVSLLIMMFFLLFILSNSYYSYFSYGYGLDIASYWMIMLTFLIVFLMILASYNYKFNNNYLKEFLSLMILMIIILMSSFMASNLFLFYILFESIMIPTLFLIFGWGYQPERLLAGFYLLFYTLFASLPMLISIFYINSSSGSLFYYLISFNCNFYLYLTLILAFLISMPMFFFHFWLPKAHVEAPVSGSMVLAGILLKLGGYGLYRVFLFINMYSVFFNYLWVIISLLGSVIVGILCLSQVDIKSMIAYSSVSHMALVIGGIMSMNWYGMWGSFIVMLGHGLCSSGMFALANSVYERTHSRMLMINKGFFVFMPSMTLFWFLLSINNMASPPSLNLMGEIFLINSLLGWSFSSMLFLAMTSFLSCCYTIYLYSLTQHGSMYSGLNFSFLGSVREFLLFFFHWLPLNLLFMKSDVFTLWI
uniref:NADH-ubiquinone oxidoreductase chain 4 n=1 Tax=Oxycarenus lugubris TaxID=2813423 RepID=A0A8T9ZYT3_9HEMI|nr:NADH dehydrogenase subunit 4 [Oxycarenus lugubris]